MAPASPAVSGSSIIPRIYDPRTLENEFHLDERKDEIEAVLAKVEGIYSRVKLDKELVMGNGFCFGLLDPDTNILVNSVISKAKAAPAAAAPSPPTDGGGRRERKRPAGRDMNQRSLDGLVAFLTCLFPYHADAEARAYLDAAELGWKLLSHGLQKFVSEISGNKSDTTVARHVLSMVKFTGGSDAKLELKEPCELAEWRLHDNPIGIGKELPPARAAAKHMLLATIHGFHLQALARLPTAELSSRYHRSVLEGGYCYGPLDPVSNIIVNTVWYELNFPYGKQVTVDMISTTCLWRVAARSLYGLVSFLCTRYPNLSPDQALQRLLVARANLQVADPNLFDVPDRDSTMQIGHGSHGTCGMQRETVEASTRSASVSEAYAAAATAAFHRNPLAQRVSWITGCRV